VNATFGESNGDGIRFYVQGSIRVMKQPNGLDRMRYFNATWHCANPAGGKRHFGESYRLCIQGTCMLSNCSEQKSSSEDKELLSQS
jgi:hypothetical protein